MSEPAEFTQAELEALEDAEPNELFENDPIRRPKKKRAKKGDKPRDERGRFALAKKAKS